MDGRKFTRLVEKISDNILRRLVFEDDLLSSSQALKLLSVITSNRSIEVVEFLNSDMLPASINILLGAFIKSVSLQRLKIRTQLYTPEYAAPLYAFIAKNISVIELDLSDCHFGDDVVKKIAPAFAINKTLKKVNLSRNDITSRSCGVLFAAFKKNTSVTNLILSFNYIHRAAMDYLTDMLNVNVTLTSIGLRANSITPSDMKKLALAYKENLSLTSINIGDNRIGDEGARFLADVFNERSRYQSVYVSENQLSEFGLISLVAGLQKNPRLTSFGCANNTIGNMGGHALATLIRSVPSLRTLYAYHCDLGYSGTSAIVAALQVNNSLTYLDLCGASFDLDSTRIFTQFLYANTTLTTLNLSECMLLDKEIQMLMAALWHHPALKKLLLVQNLFGIQGLLAISEYISVTSILTSLDLANNNLGANYTAVLAGALAVNSSLTYLKLTDNGLRERTASELARALRVNTTLRELLLDENQIDTIGALALFDSLKYNFTLRSLNLQDNQLILAVFNEKGEIVGTLDDYILTVVKNNHSLYELKMNVLLLTNQFKDKLSALLKINHKILKWLSDYHEDMFVVSQQVLQLIRSKGSEAQELVPLGCRDDMFLRCMQMALVSGELPVERLDLFMAGPVFANNYLQLFYNMVKGYFIFPRHTDRPLYRLGFFAPERLLGTEGRQIESTELTFQRDQKVLKLSFNY